MAVPEKQIVALICSDGVDVRLTVTVAATVLLPAAPSLALVCEMLMEAVWALASCGRRAASKSRAMVRCCFFIPILIQK